MNIRINHSQEDPNPRQRSLAVSVRGSPDRHPLWREFPSAMKPQTKQAIAKLEESGWKLLRKAKRVNRWWFYRTNPYDFFTDYMTVFGNGRTAKGILERGI